jgi:hypothetical protein
MNEKELISAYKDMKIAALALLQELWVAHKALTNPDHPVIVRGEKKSWEDYCNDAGIEFSIANRLLNFYDPSKTELDWESIIKIYMERMEK